MFCLHFMIAMSNVNYVLFRNEMNEFSEMRKLLREEGDQNEKFKCLEYKERERVHFNSYLMIYS